MSDSFRSTSTYQDGTAGNHRKMSGRISSLPERDRRRIEYAHASRPIPQTENHCNSQHCSPQVRSRSPQSHQAYLWLGTEGTEMYPRHGPHRGAPGQPGHFEHMAMKQRPDQQSLGQSLTGGAGVGTSEKPTFSSRFGSPLRVSPRMPGVARSRSVWRTFAGVSEGVSSRISATAPATSGVAMEVPLIAALPKSFS